MSVYDIFSNYLIVNQIFTYLTKIEIELMRRTNICQDEIFTLIKHPYFPNKTEELVERSKKDHEIWQYNKNIEFVKKEPTKQVQALKIEHQKCAGESSAKLARIRSNELIKVLELIDTNIIEKGLLITLETIAQIKIEVLSEYDSENAESIYDSLKCKSAHRDVFKLSQAALCVQSKKKPLWYEKQNLNEKEMRKLIRQKLSKKM